MTEMSNQGDSINIDALEPGIKHLSAQQIKMIDEAIDSVGQFGEVRLVVEKIVCGL